MSLSLKDNKNIGKSIHPLFYSFRVLLQSVLLKVSAYLHIKTRNMNTIKAYRHYTVYDIVYTYTVAEGIP